MSEINKQGHPFEQLFAFTQEMAEQILGDVRVVMERSEHDKPKVVEQLEMLTEISEEIGEITSQIETLQYHKQQLEEQQYVLLNTLAHALCKQTNEPS